MERRKILEVMQTVKFTLKEIEFCITDYPLLQDSTLISITADSLIQHIQNDLG